MNTTEKTDQIISLCQTLTYRQRIIFSDEGNLKIPSSIKEEEQDAFATSKPNGLWYSFGPAWICYLTNEYRDHGQTWEKKRLAWMTHVYRLSLNKSLICCIETEKQFDEFTCYFANKSASKIRWNKVSELWHGIEIRYMPSRDYGWYEGWDCSSGCIWHPKAVRKVETLMSWEPQWESNESAIPTEAI